MKKIFLLVLLASSTLFADEFVQGYYRKNGTYVQPHYKSESDSTNWNNYSTKGNTNPYTGKSGTHDPYRNSYGN